MGIEEAIVALLMLEYNEKFSKNLEVDFNEFDCRFEVLKGNNIIEISATVRITGSIYDEHFENVLVSVNELFANIKAYDFNIKGLNVCAIEELFKQKIHETINGNN